jgi:REP element-mobilizing transposase RayT
MANTFVSLLAHVVFSTKNRVDLIRPEIEPELYAYIGAIAHNHGSRLLTINGTSNHVHLLLSLSKTMAISDTIREIKKGSSSFMKSRDSAFRDFGWQDGYGGFSIGQSQVAEVKAYIARQKQHHRKQDFKEELLELLDKYEIEYDERYLWD